MKTKKLGRVVSLLMFMPIMLAGQVVRQRDPVPLKYWQAPLYWQPTPAAAESQVGATVTATATGTGPLVFVAITPCRLVDTRPTSQSGAPFPNGFGPPSLAANVNRTFAIQSS